MNVGLEVTDDLGRKQVIDTAPVLTLDSKIEVEYQTRGKRQRYSQLDPMALSPDEGLYLTYLNIYGESIHDYDLRDNGARVGHVIFTGGGTVYKFKYDIPPPVSSFGLELYNEFGELKFSSNQKPLCIIDIIDIPDIRQVINSEGEVWRKEYPNKKVAFLLLKYPVWNRGNDTVSVAPYLNNGTYSLKRLLYIDDWDVIPTWGLQAFVVDVTNY